MHLNRRRPTLRWSTPNCELSHHNMSYQWLQWGPVARSPFPIWVLARYIWVLGANKLSLFLYLSLVSGDIAIWLHCNASHISWKKNDHVWIFSQHNWWVNMQKPINNRNTTRERHHTGGILFCLLGSISLFSQLFSYHLFTSFVPARGQ